SNGTLMRTGYLLEALQPHDRDAAIAAAMQNKEVMGKGVPGVPTVRRILPDTSKKYYAAKDLAKRNMDWNISTYRSWMIGKGKGLE
ncbi:MAG: hypothetical protein O8C64_03120, partial [Candidatus Methanoperedens sp.]|nr:hypothetical protein [Candidatus Methanoperedens sp.]MCZ7406229.1 hypothetical protein [Candidatus Methanoperedens sp.]